MPVEKKVGRGYGAEESSVEPKARQGEPSDVNESRQNASVDLLHEHITFVFVLRNDTQVYQLVEMVEGDTWTGESEVLLNLPDAEGCSLTKQMEVYLERLPSELVFDLGLLLVGRQVPPGRVGLNKGLCSGRANASFSALGLNPLKRKGVP